MQNGTCETQQFVEQPMCCGTGCAVCVLDYPELFAPAKADSEFKALLDAVEQAEQQIEQMFAKQDGERQ